MTAACSPLSKGCPREMPPPDLQQAQSRLEWFMQSWEAERDSVPCVQSRAGRKKCDTMICSRQIVHAERPRLHTLPLETVHWTALSVLFFFVRRGSGFQGHCARLSRESSSPHTGPDVVTLETVIVHAEHLRGAHRKMKLPTTECQRHSLLKA